MFQNGFRTSLQNHGGVVLKHRARSALGVSKKKLFHVFGSVVNQFQKTFFFQRTVGAFFLSLGHFHTQMLPLKSDAARRPLGSTAAAVLPEDSPSSFNNVSPLAGFYTSSWLVLYKSRLEATVPSCNKTTPSVTRW